MRAGGNTDAALTIALATRAMHWRAAAGRYIVSKDRRWIPAHQFAPLEDVRDAFALLTTTNAKYSVQHLKDGEFSVRVHVGTRCGVATANSPARAIATAVAMAVGIRQESAR